MFRVYLTFSLFFNIWLTEWQNLFLFLENSFSEEFASHWFLTLYVTSFFWWKEAAFMGITLCWFSYVRVSLNKKNNTFTWLSSLYNPFKTVLVNLESKIFLSTQPWWATFKISFAVIFVGKTQIIFEKLNRTRPRPISI